MSLHLGSRYRRMAQITKTLANRSRVPLEVQDDDYSILQGHANVLALKLNRCNSVRDMVCGWQHWKA